MDLSDPSKFPRFHTGVARQFIEEERRFDNYQENRAQGQKYMTDYRATEVARDYRDTDGANIARNTRGIPFVQIPLPF